MQRRSLGQSGITVAPFAFGGNVFGWTADEATSFRLLDAFVDGGFNLIDTADVYSRWAPGNQGGESETIIGKWLKHSGKRDQVIIATKVGMEMGPSQKGLSKAYITSAVEKSLARLGIDRIDLYQSHEDDAQTPLLETLSTFDTLIRQGKVRAIGASNYSAERLAEALAISKAHQLPRYESLQPQYNLYDRADYETRLEPLCEQHHLGVITYYSLAMGFLTGKYRGPGDVSKSPRGASIEKQYMNERGQRILAALDEVAAQHGVTPGQVAIAWLIARPSVTAPIASATSVEQLQQLLVAAQLELSPSDIERLDQGASF